VQSHSSPGVFEDARVIGLYGVKTRKWCHGHFGVAADPEIELNLESTRIFVKIVLSLGYFAADAEF
jgi:hypothetical protein